MFSITEKALIKRYSIPKGWDTTKWDLEGLSETEKAAKKLDAAEIEKIKRKIRDKFIGVQFPCCCYCRRSMHQWDLFDIDTEHVLPKGVFPQWMFKMENLNISCKRCNMRKKKEDYSFFKGEVDDLNPFVSELYEFLHPNLDQPNLHLVPVVIQIGAKLLLIKYYFNADNMKAAETYSYFNLKEVEIDSVDRAQGIDLRKIADTMPSHFAAAIEALIGEDARI